MNFGKGKTFYFKKDYQLYYLYCQIGELINDLNEYLKRYPALLEDKQIAIQSEGKMVKAYACYSIAMSKCFDLIELMFNYFGLQSGFSTTQVHSSDFPWCLGRMLMVIDEDTCEQIKASMTEFLLEHWMSGSLTKDDASKIYINQFIALVNKYKKELISKKLNVQDLYMDHTTEFENSKDLIIFAFAEDLANLKNHTILPSGNLNTYVNICQKLWNVVLKMNENEVKRTK